MSSVSAAVEVHPHVETTIAAAAAAAHPRETGGLLLGWWNEGQVIVRHAVEVPDPDATGHSWSRSEPSAQAALDAALAEHQHPWLGYVGDWHSHPAACGTSAQDRTSIQRASSAYPDPLALIVYRSDGVFEVITAHCEAFDHVHRPETGRSS